MEEQEFKVLGCKHATDEYDFWRILNHMGNNFFSG